MYAIFTYIYHTNQPNAGKYTILASYGYMTLGQEPSFPIAFPLHYTTFDKENPANHLRCMKACKYWDKLPTSNHAPQIMQKFSRQQYPWCSITFVKFPSEFHHVDSMFSLSSSTFDCYDGGLPLARVTQRIQGGWMKKL